VELHNLYGPTEAAVDVTHWACVPGDARGVVPIGHPVANTRLHVLDAHLAPVPVGIPGELCLAGVQVGRGYLARPELTAERFLPDPLPAEPGARMYRTGDRVRRLPGGELEFLGRVDFQVKVRGFRIEPGEIEAVLLRHPGVRECAVVAAELAPGDTRLAAYVAPREPAPEAAELREWLRGRLPEYMIPASWNLLEALPLTPSGKLDRRALPRPETGRGGAAGDYVAPRTPVEETLAAIWSEVLGVERVGVHDSFFDLGGYSLLAVRVGSRVQEAFGVSLPLHTLFQAPTIEALALRVARARLEAQSADDIEALLAELEADPEWDAALGGETV
jgi:acyl carrier protein